MYDSFFFFNDTATTEIYTLSLHDALPIFPLGRERHGCAWQRFSWPAMRSTCSPSKSRHAMRTCTVEPSGDRKSTRLNSSHANISYAVFCLKKKIQPTYSNILSFSITPHRV